LRLQIVVTGAPLQYEMVVHIANALLDGGQLGNRPLQVDRDP
jgi:hypothetical protein